MIKRLVKANRFILLILVFISFVYKVNVLTAETNKRSYNTADIHAEGLDKYTDYENEYSSAEAWDMNYAFITGLWIPTGAANTLGSKIQLGLYLGGKRCKFEIYGTAILRLLPSANEYTYELDGVQYETDNYLGWYLGLDVGYEIIYYRRNGILILSGIGWDGFSTQEQGEDGVAYSVSSFNYNIGIGYRYYQRKNNYGYFEFDFKYNLINYKNPGGTDLSGNAMSILFLYGVLL